MLNGIALADRHGAIVFVNATWRRFAELHGSPPSIGIRYLDLCDDRRAAGLPDRGEVESQLRRLLAGEIARFELRYSWRGRHFLLRAGGVSAGGLPRVVLSHADVSDVVAAEEVLARAAGQLLHVQDEERARVARDLHDSTAQHLAAVNLGLARLRKTQAPQEVLDDMRTALAEAQREIRTLTYLLYPPQLTDQGLEATLKTFVYGFRRRTGLSVEVDVSGDLKTLPVGVQRAVFRVVQESLANVQRHARATQAAIAIALKRDGLRVTVTDDGVGRSPPIDPTTGMGIRGMQARFGQFDGLLTVSRRDVGTQVEGVIPARGLRRAEATAR
jgi:signal transduction histidine kinase